MPTWWAGYFHVFIGLMGYRCYFHCVRSRKFAGAVCVFVPWCPFRRSNVPFKRNVEGSKNVTIPGMDLNITRSPSEIRTRFSPFLHESHQQLTTTPCRTSFWRLEGKTTDSKLYPNDSGRLKLWRLLSKFTYSRPWLDASPNCRHWRLLGNCTQRRLWLDPSPKRRSRRPLGQITRSRQWLKVGPKVKLRKSEGKDTPSRLILHVKFPFSLWLNWIPKVNISRHAGMATRSKGWLKLSGLLRLLGKATPSSFNASWQHQADQALIELLAQSQASKIASGGSKHQKSSSQGFVAKSHGPKVDWNDHQMWGFEDGLANTTCADWSARQASNFGGCLGNVTPSRLWLKLAPKIKLSRVLGKVTCSKGWLNRSPKARFRRLPGNVTPSRPWLNCSPKTKFIQILNAAWQGHNHQALIELLNKYPASEAARQRHPKQNLMLQHPVKPQRFSPLMEDKLWSSLKGDEAEDQDKVSPSESIEKGQGHVRTAAASKDKKTNPCQQLLSFSMLSDWLTYGNFIYGQNGRFQLPNAATGTQNAQRQSFACQAQHLKIDPFSRCFRWLAHLQQKPKMIHPALGQFPASHGRRARDPVTRRFHGVAIKCALGGS